MLNVLFHMLVVVFLQYTIQNKTWIRVSVSENTEMSSCAALSVRPTCNHCVVKAGAENDSNSGNENEIACLAREREA